jgi:hypothetical protein
MHPTRFLGLRSVGCAQRELPVDVKAVIYECVLRFASPILPLLAQDCCISRRELSQFVIEGDLSFPQIPSVLNSRRGVESSHDGADARSSNMTNRGI